MGDEGGRGQRLGDRSALERCARDFVGAGGPIARAPETPTSGREKNVTRHDEEERRWFPLWLGACARPRRATYPSGVPLRSLPALGRPEGGLPVEVRGDEHGVGGPRPERGLAEVHGVAREGELHFLGLGLGLGARDGEPDGTFDRLRHGDRVA